MDTEPGIETKTHNEYTVGWVCALPKEQTAATAMLDQRHDDLPKPANDSNTYTLGSIGKHNIVIACLPKGHIGNSPAATVAALMVSTFPSVRFGLMVGIGGGIPPKVRLGDVVVSTPVGSFPGVVQWDRGKAKDGSFERTGSLNNPPTSLLTAITKIETEHELVGSKIPEYLDQLKQKWPRWAARYLKTDSLEDILFKADYSHVCQSSAEDRVSSGSSYESEQEESCRYCDKTKVIKRRPRDMLVHYGLIASGNQVIKSATRRDQLNKDLGANLLCVEMEAAGLMNNFPCVVIRGICDYADSHKNKDWQEYAAAVAAAFAKELLNYIQPSDVDGERRIKDVLDDVLTSVSATKADASYLKSNLDNDIDLRILEWVTSVDYGPQQSDFLRRREPGTGQWLIDSTEYQAWLGARKQTLFCPGIPGAGKTIITSIVVDHLERTYRADPTIRIAYIYCNYRRQEEQMIEKLLASLLKQLSHGQNCIPNCLRGFYEHHIEKRTQISLLEIQTALHSVAENYSTVFIIVDALDECQNTDGSRQKFLTELFSLQEKYGWNLFMTSRVIPEIVDRCSKTSISLEIRASAEDIERYLKGNIGQLPAFVQRNQELQQKIAAEISEAVDGMFLLAQIYLNSLTDKMTPKAIKNALTSFRKTVSGLGETEKTAILAYAYEQAMQRINGQQSGFKELAHKVLLWIVCAERQLTATELQHALAVEFDELELDKENLPSIQDMVSVCAGLVTIDYESNVIRLVHYTTQEYFNQTHKRWFSDADMTMADTCASYLLFKGFEGGVCRTDKDFTERSTMNPFYNYAAHNWGHHARKASKLCRKVMDFLECKTNMKASIEALRHDLYSSEGLDQRPEHKMTSLHLAAYFGIEETVKAFLKKTINVNTKDGSGATPLSWSARNGHEHVVKLLLAIPSIEADSRSGSWNETPLSLAAWNGHEAVVKLLLTVPGVNINSWDPYRGTPLFGAAQNGHDAVVELLVEAGADPNLGSMDQTPLSLAAWNGHDAVVKVLLTISSIDTNSWDPYFGTPLFRAAWNGHEAVVKSLLSAGANPNLGNTNQTPLSLAAYMGRETVVKLLLAAPSININSWDPQNGTPLHRAVENRHAAVVRLLLTARAKADRGNQFGTTPLICAASSGDISLVKMLLKAEADPKIRDQLGSTPLSCAVAQGHDAVVRLLLAAGAHVNLSPDDWKSILHIAAEKGHGVIMKLLLVNGTHPYFGNEDGQISPWHAADNEDEALMEVLLAARADPDISGTKGTPPLWHAAQRRDEVAVKALLAAGAIPDIHGPDGSTPLTLAAFNGDNTIVEILLTAGANPDLGGDFGRPPLTYAAEYGDEELVRLLLAAGADRDLGDEYSQTPLGYAAVEEHEVVVELLLAAGVNPNLGSADGTTPIWCAAGRGNKFIVEKLLAAGAKPNVRGGCGRTPLLMAQERGYEPIVKLLSNRGAKADLVEKSIMARSSTSVDSGRKRNYDEVE